MPTWDVGLKAHGPDQRLVVELDEPVLTQLRQRLRGRSTPGLQRVGDGDLYVDDHHAAQVKANIEGRNVKNVYIFTSVELGAREVTFERGYGGAEARGDDEILLELLAHPVERWSISTGGATYAWQEVAAGVGAASLRQRLAA